MSQSQTETDEITNRPGQDALAYRITDHAGSLRRMLGRLHTYTISDGPNRGSQPLAELTTRAATDPSIALLDACAAVFDVLSFYQERIADEGYLRTAKEDYSLRQLTRTIGYQPAPALAASTYLAFTVDTTAGMPESVTVPAGTQVKSVPGQNELPQTFETTTAFVARASCNQLKPQRTCVQRLIASSDDKTGTAITTLRLDGVSSRVREGDLLRVAGTTTLRVMGVMQSTSPRYTDLTVSVVDGPQVRLQAATSLPGGDAKALPTTLTASAVTEHILGRTWDDETLVACLRERGWSAADLVRQVQKSLAAVQAPQVLITYRQQLGFFGVTALPFASLPKPDTTYYRGTDLYAASGSSWDDSDGNNLRTIWVDSWGNRYSDKSPNCDVYLERSTAGILPGSSLLLVCPRGVSEQTVTSAVEASVRGYATLARTTGLKVSAPPASAAAATSDTFLTRDTVAYVQSETLPVCATVPLPMIDAQSVRDRVTLDTLLIGLPSGQPLLISGELADAPGTTGSEVAFLAQATHIGGYTTLYFRAPLEHDYALSSVTVSANVVEATHGETVASETLGSGDGTQVNQRFTLKRKPLTYLPAVGESGSASTLEVRVNGVLWREVPSLLGADAKSPCYVIERSSSDSGDGSASVLFGDGLHGARLPSGKDNVVASYRFGSGPSGMVRSGSLQLLLTRPLGLRGVGNPLAPVGGAGAETVEQMRENAPLSARTLGRAVSLSDYEALAGAFPDIAKAQAVSVLLGGANAVHLTVATEDGAPLLTASALYQSLLGALRTLGNPLQTLLLDDYVPRKFRVKARLAVDPLRISTEVRDAVAAALRDAFSFDSRSFAEPVYSSDVISVMQGVAGVNGAILDALYRTSDAPAENAMLTASPAFVDHEGASRGAELLLLELFDGDLEVLS